MWNEIKSDWQYFVSFALTIFFLWIQKWHCGFMKEIGNFEFLTSTEFISRPQPTINWPHIWFYSSQNRQFSSRFVWRKTNSKMNFKVFALFVAFALVLCSASSVPQQVKDAVVRQNTWKNGGRFLFDGLLNICTILIKIFLFHYSTDDSDSSYSMGANAVCAISCSLNGSPGGACVCAK